MKREYFHVNNPWIKALCLLAMLALVLFSFSMLSAVWTSGEFTYFMAGPGVRIVRYTGVDQDVKIPDALDGHPVSGICSHAFAGNTNLVQVFIPASITSIGSGAFASCPNLTDACFSGPAPAAPDNIFQDCAAGFTIFFLKGQAGWTGNWLGYPAIKYVLPQTDATLASLLINGMMVPGFCPDCETYDIGDVASCLNTLEIDATPSDPAASVEGDGQVPFGSGDPREIRIRVLAADRMTENTYCLRISRTAAVHDQAIFVLPGIMGSELYSSEGELLWLPEKLIQLPFWSDRRIERLGCLPDGRSREDIAGRDSLFQDEHYGTYLFWSKMNAYDALVKMLKDTEPDCDIRFFPYDWRLDNRISIDKLRMHIELGGYRKVTLIGHSMGGIIAAGYAALYDYDYLSDCSNKIDKLITLGTPYLGSPQSALGLINGQVFHLFSWTLPINNSDMRQLCLNLIPVYQLLPGEEYFQCQGGYLLLGSAWAKSGSGRVASSQETEAFLQQAFSARDFASPVSSLRQILFRDGRHIVSRMTNARVIIGKDVHTIKDIEIGGKQAAPSVKIRFGIDGDGTVPCISANIGGTTDPEHTYYVSGIKHYSLVKEEEVLQLVREILRSD
jgi:pimeloyl-ACP methyl ester carboxylesterase